jgi:ABC-type phosphate transport system, permease component
LAAQGLLQPVFPLSRIPTSPSAFDALQASSMRLFRHGLQAVSAIIPLVLLAVFVFLAAYSWPAIQFNGLHFLFSNTWSLGNLYANPVQRNGFTVPMGAHYGIAVFIVGTLASSAIALLLAVPWASAWLCFWWSTRRIGCAACSHKSLNCWPWCPAWSMAWWGLEVLAPFDPEGHCPVPGACAALHSIFLGSGQQRLRLAHGRTGAGADGAAGHLQHPD